MIHCSSTSLPDSHKLFTSKESIFSSWPLYYHWKLDCKEPGCDAGRSAALCCKNDLPPAYLCSATLGKCFVICWLVCLQVPFGLLSQMQQCIWCSLDKRSHTPPLHPAMATGRCSVSFSADSLWCSKWAQSHPTHRKWSNYAHQSLHYGLLVSIGLLFHHYEGGSASTQQNHNCSLPLLHSGVIHHPPLTSWQLTENTLVFCTAIYLQPVKAVLQLCKIAYVSMLTG